MIRIALALATAAALTACAGSPANPAPESPPAPWPLQDVGSACDENGNRVYKWQSNSHLNGLAVVGSDPTCQKLVIR